MEKTLKVLNELKTKGLIQTYAIGGGIATIFYTEPSFTYDLDVFLIVDVDPGKKIVSLASIYDYLKKKGYPWKGEHIVIEGMPVQFVPAGSDLEHDAIVNSRTVNYARTKTRVLKAEYLIAIALKVGRKKDLEKIGRLVDQTRVNKTALERILRKHDLLEKFKKWKEKSK